MLRPSSVLRSDYFTIDFGLLSAMSIGGLGLAAAVWLTPHSKSATAPQSPRCARPHGTPLSAAYQI